MGWHYYTYLDGDLDAKFRYFSDKSSTLQNYCNKLKAMRENASYVSVPPTSGYVYGDFARLYYDKSAQFTDKLNNTIEKYDSFIFELGRCASRAESLAEQYERSRYKTGRYWVDDDD